MSSSPSRSTVWRLVASVALVVAPAVGLVVAGSSPASAQTSFDEVDRWSLLPLPEPGPMADIAYDADGGAWVISTDGLVSQITSRFDLGWGVTGLPATPDAERHGIASQPGRAGHAVAWGDEGVFRTRDRGRTWRPAGVRSTQVHDVLFDPGAPERWIIAYEGGVFASTEDDGATWTTTVVPPRAAGTGLQVANLALAPDGDVFFLLSLDDDCTSPCLPETGVYRSTDFGATWALRSNASGVFLTVAPDGSLYADLDQQQLMRSTDDGATWTPVDLPVSAGADVVELLFEPTRILAFLASMDVYASTDGGLGWRYFSFHGYEIGGVAAHPTRTGQYLLAVSQVLDRPSRPDIFPAVVRFVEEDLRWVGLTRRLPGNAPVAVAPHPTEPEVVLAAARGMVHRLPGFAQTWRNVLPRRLIDLAYEDVVFAPSDPSRAYAGASSGIPGFEAFYRSLDGGVTWEATEPGPVVSFIRDVAVAFDDPDLVFDARLGDPDRDEAGVFRSADAGTTTTRVLEFPTTRVFTDPASPSFVYAVDFDRRLWRSGDRGDTWTELGDSSTLVAAGADALWRRHQVGPSLTLDRSDDRGTTWRSVPPPPLGLARVTALAASPDRPGTLALGSLDGWTAVTFDAGESWRTIAGDFGVPIRDLTFSRADGALWAASDAGVLRAPLSPEAQPERVAFGDGRFVATVDWEDFDGNVGTGRGELLTNDTVSFYFFDPANIELTVKLLDGRPVNGSYWVFFGSLSNVEFTLRVEDLLTGDVAEYANPLGTFASVGDVDPF